MALLDGVVVKERTCKVLTKVKRGKKITIIQLTGAPGLLPTAK